MKNATQTTIDASGRLVLPKVVRERAGLRAGTVLDVRVAGGRIELEPAPLRVRLVRHRGFLVAEAEEPIPPLSAEQVRSTLEELRERRDEDT